ncbi:TPA: phosphatidylserine decarboxylase family protein [Candidatus Sumerlaeota bacterium]|jgi:phosphatidylserine decarboxylase|nr:phosphatidylserine decarboxylase family protein [Candidatus Sumerlaeota bacterium]
MNSSSKHLLPIAKEGWAFIVPSIALTLICLVLAWSGLAIFFALLAIACIGFFRDPERAIPQGDHLILSPADGKITSIEEVTMEPTPGQPVQMRRVAIFLSVFNAHVQRTPVAGTVTSVKYFQGQFINAIYDKASDLNEHNMIWLQTAMGPIGVKQIAGLIARRIVCFVKPGRQLPLGERVGLIRFGSRTDAYFPLEAELKVQVGDAVKAGLHILAEMPQK